MSQTRIRRTFWNRLKQPLAGLVLTFGVFLASVPPTEAQTSAIASSPETASTIQTASVSDARSASHSKFPADGIYLYGQSPQPGQLGVDYAVMEVRDRQAVGAFYRVSSSFDCFYGEVGSEQLDLTIVSSYDQVAYDYSLNLDYSEVLTASDGNASNSVGLIGFHSIDTVSDLDMNILSTCRAEHAQEI